MVVAYLLETGMPISQESLCTQPSMQATVHMVKYQGTGSEEASELVLSTLDISFPAVRMTSAVQGFIQPVPLEDVMLQAGSQFDKAMSLNKKYLLGIDSDRMLKTFR